MPQTPEARRKRYAEDAEYRERKKRQSQEWRERNPEKVAAQLARKRAAYQPLDVEGRAAIREYQREWRRAKRASDPSFAARDREARMRYEASGRRPAANSRWAGATDRYRSKQKATARNATRSEKHYTPSEDAVVMRSDLTLQERAIILGRTYNSVVYRRTRLLKGL